jgi:hypothetical protein
LAPIPGLGSDLFPTLVDPWGQRYEIDDWATSDARIVCLGPDQTKGTSDDLTQHLLK